MLDSELIETQNAYRRPLNLEEKIDNYMPEEKLIDKENLEEHYVRKGDPSKPTYYIIRRKSWPGLFATVTMVIAHIRYAVTNNWIPVVDMQNYPSGYLAPEKFGKENAWEYYFEQPRRIGLEEAYNGENIILSAQECPIAQPWGLLYMKEDILSEWRMFVKLGFLKIKSEITEEVMTIRDKLFPPKILGAHLRGTDYLNRPARHMIPPPQSMLSM